MTRIGQDGKGCLAQVPGTVIGAVIAKMSRPDEAKTKTDVATVDVPGLGRVTITCVLRRDVRRKTQYWSAVRADVTR